MKKLIAIAMLTMCPLMAPAVQYVGINAGTNHLVQTNKSTGPKTGMHLGGKYGYMFESGVRCEAEMIYRKNDYQTVYTIIDKDQVGSKEHNSSHSWSYMANVIYDIFALRTSDLVPYFGAGVGYCQNTEKNKIKYNDITKEDKLKDNRIAYQLIGGAKYKINDEYTAGAEYHYFVGKSHAKEHSVHVTVMRAF